MVNRGRTPYLTAAQKWRVSRGLDPGTRPHGTSSGQPEKSYVTPRKEKYELISTSKSKQEMQNIAKRLKEFSDIKTLIIQTKGTYGLYAYPIIGTGENAHLPPKSGRK